MGANNTEHSRREQYHQARVSRVMGSSFFRKKENFQSANGLLHIDLYISNVGCFPNIDDAQLGGMHNVAICIIKSSLMLNPVCHDFTKRFNHLQKATVPHNKNIRCPPSITWRDIRNSPIRCDCNKNLERVVMLCLILTP